MKISGYSSSPHTGSIHRTVNKIRPTWLTNLIRQIHRTAATGVHAILHVYMNFHYMILKLMYGTAIHSLRNTFFSIFSKCCIFVTFLVTVYFR
jgi:hypothetical protein